MEIIKTLIKGVEEHEPEAFQYELFRKVDAELGSEELVFIEQRVLILSLTK